MEDDGGAVAHPGTEVGDDRADVPAAGDLAEVIADYLQRSGFDVEITGDGAAAVAAAHRTPPDVVVLDEATAHLDIPSERLVQKALATVLEGRTAIIIAHRLSTVEIADRVLVMDAGRIVEDGPPHELRRRGGEFEALWRMQAEGFSREPGAVT